MDFTLFHSVLFLHFATQLSLAQTSGSESNFQEIPESLASACLSQLTGRNLLDEGGKYCGLEDFV